MRTRIRLGLVAGVATLAFLSAVAASADHIRVSATTFRETWPSWEWRTGTTFVVKCPVTFEGSYHSSTFPKTAGLLLGYVTRATVASAMCTGGSATAKQETLPWHFRYGGFFGRLPRFERTRENLVGETFEILTFGTRTACTMHSEAADPAGVLIGVEPGGAATEVRDEEEDSIPLEGFESICLGNVTERGTATITAVGTTTRITLTLI